MNSLTRRDLLKSGLLSAAGWELLAASPVARAIPPIGRTRPSHLKLSIAAYSYRDFLTAKPPKMDLFDFANLAADMGLDAIEPTSYYFPHDVTADYLHRLKQHAFLLGLDISETAIGNNFCLPPGTKRDEQLANTRAWIDRAAELDAPVIRIFAGNVPGGDRRASCRLGDRGNQGSRSPMPPRKALPWPSRTMAGSPRPRLRFSNWSAPIDAPNFGVNLDTGNFHGEDPYAEIAELAPYAVNVQVKTEIRRKGAHANEEADLSRLISILREVRYSGYVVLEYEAAEDPLKAIPRHIKKLRELIG